MKFFPEPNQTPVRRCAVIALVALSSALSVSAMGQTAVPFVPGKYELINSGDGKPVTDCYLEPYLNAAVLQKKMNAAFKGKDVCTILETAHGGDSLGLAITCQYPDGMSGRGDMTITVSGERFLAVSSFELSVNGQTRMRNTKTNGKRIGPC